LLQAVPRLIGGDLQGAPALAKAPMLGTQAPYFYRFKLGNAEATVGVRTARCRSAIRTRTSSASPPPRWTSS
jgi:hypothetical protein